MPSSPPAPNPNHSTPPSHREQRTQSSSRTQSKSSPYTHYERKKRLLQVDSLSIKPSYTPSKHTLCSILDGPLVAAVESDIVGYKTTPLSRGFIALSIPFSSLEGETEGYPIANLSGELYANDNLARADYLLVQDPTSKQYTAYYYKAQGWTKKGEEFVTTDVISPGQGVFLYKNRTAGSVFAAGKVLDEKTRAVELKRGLNIVANPYPTPMLINALSGELYPNSNPNRADSIQRLNPETKEYTTYVLMTTGWHKLGADGVVEASPTTDSISADECFVLNKMRSDGKLDFTHPIQ